MNFNEELKQRVEQINALLAAKLPAEEGMQQRVAEAMNYSVNAGGKRLRPMLLLEVYRLLGGTDEKNYGTVYGGAGMYSYVFTGA